MLRKICALIVIFCLLLEQAGISLAAPVPGMPAYLADIVPAADTFRPVRLRSISIDPARSEFDLLLDLGDSPNIRRPELDLASDVLMRYFRVGLVLPNSAFWVNLRPDAPDEIIDPYLEKTDVGEILVKSDLMLKQDLARMTDPANPAGREYWDKLYAKAEQLFGGEDVQIPMATRPWIVPGEIILRETGTGVYIYKAILSVRMEQDYIKDSPFHHFDDPRLKVLNEYSSKLLSDKILPKLTREINSSKRYSELRQVFYSLVLAQWLKQRLADSGERLGLSAADSVERLGLSAADSVERLAVSGETADRVKRLTDSKDLTGLTSRKPWSKQKYYNAYRASFEQGEYNKEAVVRGSNGDTVCRYFSGGMNLDGGSLASAVIIKAGENRTDINIGRVPFKVENLRWVNSESNKDGGITVPLAKAIGALMSVGELDYDAAFRDPVVLTELVDSFSGNPQRMERLAQQAGTFRQAAVEIISNAIDATLARQGERSIGRFGIGAYQTLGLLNGPEDSISWTTSVDGITGYRVTITKKDEQFYLTIGVASGVRERGTVFEARVADFQQKEKEEEYRAYIARKFGLTTRMAVFMDGKLVNTIEDIKYINGDPLPEHKYPNARVDVNIDSGGFSVIDRGTGMSARDILTKLLIPRAGVNRLPARTLNAGEIADQTAVFYRMHEGKPLNEARHSYVSIQVAGVEIERIEAVGYNLPQCLVVELPADTVLTTERSFVQFDEQTREAVLSVVKKIINQGGEDTPALLNGVALLLQSWEKRNKQAEPLVRNVRKMVRDWVEEKGVSVIVLPSQSELLQVDQDVDGVNYAPDGFYELDLPGEAHVIHVSDYLYAFKPAPRLGFSRPPGWSSKTGYELWTAPFREGSSKVFILHRRYVIVDRKRYELNAGNPAAIALLVNPNNDYVPQEAAEHIRVSYLPGTSKQTSMDKSGVGTGAPQTAFATEEYLAADDVLSCIGLTMDNSPLLFHSLADLFRREPKAVDEMNDFTGNLLALNKSGIIDQSDYGRFLQQRFDMYGNNRPLSLAINLSLRYNYLPIDGLESVFRMLMENDRMELAMFLVSFKPSWKGYLIKGAIDAGKYDLASSLIDALRIDDPSDALRYDKDLAIAKARDARDRDVSLLLEKMNRARDSLFDPAVRDALFNNIDVLLKGMETLIALGMEDKAAQYLDDAMRGSLYSVNPVVAIYEGSILGYISRIIGKEEQAKDLFSLAMGKTSPKEFDDDRFDWQFHYVTLISKYLAMSGKEADAADMLKSLLQEFNKTGYNRFVTESSEAYYVDAVREILSAGRFDDVFELISELQNYQSLKMLTYYLAGREAVRQGRFNEVMVGRLRGEDDIFKAAVSFGKYRGLFEAGNFHQDDVKARNELERAVSSLEHIIPQSWDYCLLFKRFVEDASVIGMYSCAERLIRMMDNKAYQALALLSLWSGMASRDTAENAFSFPIPKVTEEVMTFVEGYVRDNENHFSQNPADRQMFLTNLVCFPPNLQGKSMDSIVPFLTFVSEYRTFGLFDKETIGKVSDAVKDLSLPEQKTFFALLNNIAPGQKPADFSVVAAQWARLYTKLGAKEDVVATLVDLAARNSSVFIPGSDVDPDTSDPSIAMFAKYLRGDLEDILFEGKSDFEHDREEMSLVYSADGVSLTLDMINNLFRKYPQNIRSMETLAQFMDFVRDRAGDISQEEAARQQEQIIKTISGQDTAEYVFMRELVQNSRDAMRNAGVSGSIEIRSFISSGERIVSVEDPVGMPLSTLLGPLLVIDETTKADDLDAAGMFGIGFYTIFAASDEVRIQTSSGDGKVFFVEIDRDSNGVFTVTRFEQRSGEYKGTRIESVRKSAADKDIFLEAVFIADSLVRNCGAIRDTDIEFNGRKIVDDLTLVGSVKTTLGELKLYTGSKPRVCLDQLYVEPPSEEYFALVPQEYLDIIRNSGLVVELPEDVKLTSSRKTVFDKDTNMPVIQRAIAAAVYQAVVYMFLYGNQYPKLTQDFLSLKDSATLIAPEVKLDAAAVNAGQAELVDFSKYVSTPLDSSEVRAKKNAMVSQLVPLIEITTREGERVTLDDIRQKLRGGNLKEFGGTGKAYNSYVQKAKTLISRDRNVRRFTRDEAFSNERYAGFLRMANLAVEWFGLGGLVSVLLAEGGSAPAFFVRDNNTIYFNINDVGVKKMLADAAKSIAAGSAEGMYSFYYRFLDMLSHEAAHYFSGSHERETNMDGVFGWHKAKLLLLLVLSGKTLDDLAKESGEDGGSLPAKDGGKGGIDFRALPVTQSVTGEAAVSSAAVSGRTVIKNMDAEWASIISAAEKQVPCGRIKAYWAVCCTSSEAQQYKQKVIAYIEQLLSWEEARAVNSSAELKDLLACIG